VLESENDVFDEPVYIDVAVGFSELPILHSIKIGDANNFFLKL
jgi:hypothetical protein